MAWRERERARDGSIDLLFPTERIGFQTKIATPAPPRLRRDRDGYGGVVRDSFMGGLPAARVSIRN